MRHRLYTFFCKCKCDIGIRTWTQLPQSITAWRENWTFKTTRLLKTKNVWNQIEQKQICAQSQTVMFWAKRAVLSWETAEILSNGTIPVFPMFRTQFYEANMIPQKTEVSEQHPSNILPFIKLFKFRPNELHATSTKSQKQVYCTSPKCYGCVLFYAFPWFCDHFGRPRNCTQIYS